MQKLPLPPGFQDMLGFGLVEALLGRRSRRFFRGAEIPDGVFAYKSKHPPLPLSELEKLLVVLACGGNTNWHHLIYRAARYAPHLSNYCGAAGGRTFPSSAGFETSQTFFTDDEGVYLLDVRDGPALGERDQNGALDLEQLLAAHQGCIKKIRDGASGPAAGGALRRTPQHLGGEPSRHPAGDPGGRLVPAYAPEPVLSAAKRPGNHRRP